jgi:hypothetical protein
MVKPKHAFVFALIFSIAVFSIGIFIGFSMENIRNNFAYQAYIESETNLLDARLQNYLLSNFPIKDCNLSTQKNIEFGDRIYEEAGILKEYEEANKISQTILLEHKKFDLLRALFWLNSMKIQEKCDSSIINVVYFYKLNDVSLDERAKQNVFSNLLYEIKKEYGNDIMLIPISGDNNLTSVEILMQNYDITELPAVLVNEKIKVSEIIDLEDFKDIIDKELAG